MRTSSYNHSSLQKHIPRVIVEKIGYPILDALNNIGNREVKKTKT